MWAGWARASATSTTPWCAATGSRRPPTRSRTCTWRARRTRPPRRAGGQGGGPRPGGRGAAAVGRGGLGSPPAPESPPFPTREEPLKPYEAAVLTVEPTRGLVREIAPDAVVGDILTVGAGLAA